MPTETAISWTDFSSNPVKYRDRETGRTVWACVKKSDGCTNCYSEALALRWNKGRAFSRPNIDKVTPFLDEREMRRLGHDPKLSGHRVFVGDMTDLFGDWVPDDFLDDLFAVFAWRQDVTWQLLTKRPERMLEWFREAFQFRRTDGGIGYHGRQERVFERMQESPYITIDPHNDAHWKTDGSYRWPGWPLPNVWLGTSVEDQRAANERIPLLIDAPSVVRYLSCEPLLGSVQIDPDWMMRLDQIIVGGESGPRHRPMDLLAFTSLCAQARVAGGVALFTKQDSGLYPGRQGRIPDDYWLHQFPEPAPSPATGSAGR